MQTPPQTRLRFQFEGGDADEGQLNFYDASRFQYGAARFVYTLEHFRQTGIAMQKITQRVNADYRVPTFQRGSWIMDVLQIAVPTLAETTIKVPIQAIMAHVMERLTPGRRSREVVKEAATENKSLGDLLIAQERERTAQERARTEQIRLLTQTNSQVIDFANKALERPRLLESPTAQLLKEIRDELKASSERDRMLVQYRRELDNIDPARLDRVLDKARGQVVEMGKPLIRSADRLLIAEGTRSEGFVSLSRRSVEQLSGNSMDPLPSLLIGNIVRFDKESGWENFGAGSSVDPYRL
jgi:hypothetical protein